MTSTSTFALLLLGGPLDGETIHLPAQARGLALQLGKIVLPAWGAVPDGVDPNAVPLEQLPVNRVIYGFAEIFSRDAEVVTIWTYEKVF